MVYSLNESSDESASTDLIATEDSYDFYSSSKLDVSVDRGVTTNDYSFSGKTFNVQLIEDVKNGVLSLKSDGSFTYDHDGSYTMIILNIDS